MPAGIDNLPEMATAESLDDDDFLVAFHHALLEVGSRNCTDEAMAFAAS